MRTLFITLGLFIILAAGAVWFIKSPPTSLTATADGQDLPAPVPDPETYAVTVADIKFHREKLATEYRQARTDSERQKVIGSARSLLELTMPSLMRCWLGTPWDFNGIASEPGGGKVACGYFVSTVMRDAGFDVHRIRLAQQASQNILRTFLPRNQLHIKTATEYSDYMDIVRGKPHGIYIIGLDKHVGFLVHNDGGLRFIHSGGLLQRVVDESQAEAYSIQQSNYRVIGNLTGSDELIRKWLLNTPFPTHL